MYFVEALFKCRQNFSAQYLSQFQASVACAEWRRESD
jgi:hypothetical protein